MTTFNVAGTLQTYTVPTTGIYDITAIGGAGGTSFGQQRYLGGFGAELGGDVLLRCFRLSSAAIAGADVITAHGRFNVIVGLGGNDTVNLAGLHDHHAGRHCQHAQRRRRPERHRRRQTCSTCARPWRRPVGTTSAIHWPMTCRSPTARPARTLRSHPRAAAPANYGLPDLIGSHSLLTA